MNLALSALRLPLPRFTLAVDVELHGRVAGLSPRGELELDTSEGRRLIAAGDVYFSNAA